VLVLVLVLMLKLMLVGLLMCAQGLVTFVCG
jgi:hypothetical protein